jgi:hypothetical protein
VPDSNRLICRVLQSGHGIRGRQPAASMTPDELPVPDMAALDLSPPSTGSSAGFEERTEEGARDLREREVRAELGI